MKIINNNLKNTKNKNRTICVKNKYLHIHRVLLENKSVLLTVLLRMIVRKAIFH